jgi:hypothetical protein
MSASLHRNRRHGVLLSPRFGTLRANRPFYGWLLERRRRLRLKPGGEDLRVTEDGQERFTELGQPREL